MENLLFPLSMQVSKRLLEPDTSIAQGAAFRSADTFSSLLPLIPSVAFGGNNKVSPAMQIQTEAASMSPNEGRWRLSVVDPASADQKFRYFTERVIRCQIWRDDEGSLFSRLKVATQDLMDRIAVRCDSRYLRLGSEPGGDALVLDTFDGFSWPEPSCAVRLNETREDGPRRICRQDHQEVGAIRVDEKGRQARLLESCIFERRCSSGTMLKGHGELCGPSSAGALMTSIGGEEVFLHQLLQIARLLDTPFQETIVDVIRRHSLEPQGPPTTAQAGPIKIECNFSTGPGIVEVHPGPVKRVSRMNAKLAKYAPPHPRGMWPLAANILDPVRASVVCNGPAQILEILGWFAAESSGLALCRVKNKFARTSCVDDGYRDLSLSVVFSDSSGLRLIGEVQIHDREMHELKLQMHRLYTVKRAIDSSNLFE